MKAQLHCIASELVSAARRGRRGRTEQEVIDHYDRPGSGKTKAVISPKLDEHVKLAMHRIGDTVHSLGVTRVCEVGCGSGRNLIYLNSCFSGLELSGFDIAVWRVGNAVNRGVDARIGSAFDLPVKAKSFELVFTFAALEQMNTRIDEALFQIRRASSRFALFYEPFADNNGPLDRLYLWSRNYFRMYASSLNDYGFSLMWVDTMYPKKATFGYALVLCEVL